MMLFIAGSLILGLLWIRTGKDPLFHAARVLLILRACVIQAGESIGWAARHWLAGMPERLVQVHREAKL